MARRKMDKVRTEVTEIENLRPYVISSHFAYPAVMINVQPRSYEIWTVLPDQRDPEACTIAIRVVVAKAATAEEREEVDRTWSVLLDAAEQDDWPMEVSIQQNVRHAPMDTFLCGTSEQPLQHFHRRLADHLGGSGRH
jgi:hypothetical protein